MQTKLLTASDGAAYRKLDAAALKWIAIITMLIDHIGAFILEPYIRLHPDSRLASLDLVFRLIGRLAFPIFAFLLTEGIIHTHSGWPYIGRLAAFALISEIPFDLAIGNTIRYPSHQNIFFTLTLAAVSLYLHRILKNPVTKWGVLIFAPVMAWLLHTDYSFYGIMVIYVFYFLRDQFMLRNVLAFALLTMQMTASLAVIPIALYNGQRGRQSKYFFYIFYPAHLLILWLIARTFIY